MQQFVDWKDMNFGEGKILLINKPFEWSSFDVVRKVRNTLSKKIKGIKVGHAGTLDPLATGLLIVCTGKMTKRICDLQDMEKEYEGTLVIGKTTPSFDLETEIDSERDISSITPDQIKSIVPKFMGKTMQVPPIFSAVKVNGERVYKKARRGEDVKIEAKEIFIREFELTSIQIPEIKFRVVCSKGTYIRSLVRDFGEVLGTGAYMSSLTRTRIGEFKIQNACDVNDFVKQLTELQ